MNILSFKGKIRGIQNLLNEKFREIFKYKRIHQNKVHKIVQITLCMHTLITGTRCL